MSRCRWIALVSNAQIRITFRIGAKQPNLMSNVFEDCRESSLMDSSCSHYPEQLVAPSLSIFGDLGKFSAERLHPLRKRLAKTRLLK